MFVQQEYTKEKSFAFGLNLYKIFWLLIFFSFYGYIFETVIAFIKFGEFHNRQGLLYGPFIQIYGIGAIIIISISHYIKKNSIVFLFLLSSIMGGSFEYLFSLIEETIYGCTSWNYYHMPLNLDGRTSILMSLVWGAAGVIIVKYLYPITSKIIECFPNKKGIVITWIVFLFLSYDVFLSSAVVIRAAQRFNNLPPSNTFEVYIDEKYPDSYMEKKFPTLKFR